MIALGAARNTVDMQATSIPFAARFRSVRFALALALATVAAPVQAQNAAASPPATTQPAKPGDALLRKLWWNRSSLVTQFNLTLRQREQMDAKFLAMFQKEREAQRKVQTLRAAYDADLRSGHWGAARMTGEKLAESQKAALAIQHDGRVDVLTLLTEEQLAAVVQAHPRLLTAMWLPRQRPQEARKAAGKPGTSGGPAPTPAK